MQNWVEELEDSVTYSTDVTCLSWVGGKVPSYGEGKAGQQEEGLYYIYMWSVCGEEGELEEKLGRRSWCGSLCVRQGTTVCQSVPT